MIGEPWFWRDESIAAKAVVNALAPLAWLYEQGAAARRRFVTPWRAPVPVICVGNASVGGAGKTPFALMLGRLLQDNGLAPHFLSRGYGGEAKGPLRVDPQKHSAREVGDEPLLLANAAPAWISRNKRAGAEAAIASGAQLIIMDDGFQNPTIAKDISILLIDANSLASNQKIFPAGPMREQKESAIARADIVVEIKQSAGAPSSRLGANFTAWLEPEHSSPERALAFCGIANPERFFNTLERVGFDIADAIAFPDHYAYSDKNIAALKSRAKKLGAELVTTEKDWVRIEKDMRDGVKTLPVRMQISDPDAMMALVVAAIEKRLETRR